MKKTSEPKLSIAQIRRSNRDRQILELILTGHNQKEAAAIVGCSQNWACGSIRYVWPFPPAAWDFRYFITSVSVEDVPALKSVAGDMALTPWRALEEVIHAVLESDALVARRILKVQGRPADGPPSSAAPI